MIESADYKDFTWTIGCGLIFVDSQLVSLGNSVIICSFLCIPFIKGKKKGIYILIFKIFYFKWIF